MKTIDHMKFVNLKRYQVTTLDDAFAVIEDNGDSLTAESSRDRGTASLERGLALSTRGAQAITLSQKGKKDTMVFTLQVRCGHGCGLSCRKACCYRWQAVCARCS